MTLHLGIGSLLGASPWLGDFADRVYLPHLCLGLLWLLAGRSWEVSRPVRNELNWAKIPLGEIQLVLRASYSFWSIDSERQMCLDLLSKGKLDDRKLITHRFLLNEVNKAFETAEDKEKTHAVFMALIV